MAKNKERKNSLDPSVADLLHGMEKRTSELKMPRKDRDKLLKERAKIEARKEQRVTYDLPPQIKQYIKDLAENESVPASQIVTLALMRFIEDFEKNDIDLAIYKQTSRSPRYDWNLIFPDKNKNKIY
jgi:predicted DNA-binding protein